MVACFVGVAVITLGVCLCILGYEAKQESRDSYEKEIVDSKNENVLKNPLKYNSIYSENFQNKDELARSKDRYENFTVENVIESNISRTNKTKGSEATRYFIYVGPVIMSFGSFAIVFACVIVCETRDRVLDLLEKRTKQLENMVIKDMKEKVMEKGDTENLNHCENFGIEENKFFLTEFELSRSLQNNHKDEDCVHKSIGKEHEENRTSEGTQEVGEKTNLMKELEENKKVCCSNELSFEPSKTTITTNSSPFPTPSLVETVEENFSKTIYSKNKQKIVFNDDLLIIPNHYTTPVKPSDATCEIEDFSKEVFESFEKFHDNGIGCSAQSPNHKTSQVHQKQPSQPTESQSMEQPRPSQQPNQPHKLQPNQIYSNQSQQQQHNLQVSNSFENSHIERRSSFQLLYKMKIDVLTNSLIKNQLKKAIRDKKKEMKKLKKENDSRKAE